MSIYEKLDLIIAKLERIEKQHTKDPEVSKQADCDHDFHVGSHDMVCDKCELHFPIDLYASTPWYK
jgi:hypothetical protein